MRSLRRCPRRQPAPRESTSRTSPRTFPGTFPGTCPRRALSRIGTTARLAGESAARRCDEARVSHINDLCRLTGEYLEPAEVEKIRRAFQFGADAHEGQRRASGEPYIHHPLKVAQILAEMRLDPRDDSSPRSSTTSSRTPGPRSPSLRPASAIPWPSSSTESASSRISRSKAWSRPRPRTSARSDRIAMMARDIRVMLIKLADRLHNMRTLDALKPGKQRRISRETDRHLRSHRQSPRVAQHSHRTRGSRLPCALPPGAIECWRRRYARRAATESGSCARSKPR